MYPTANVTHVEQQKLFYMKRTPYHQAILFMNDSVNFYKSIRYNGKLPSKQDCFPVGKNTELLLTLKKYAVDENTNYILRCSKE